MGRKYKDIEYDNQENFELDDEYVEISARDTYLKESFASLKAMGFKIKIRHERLFIRTLKLATYKGFNITDFSYQESLLITKGQLRDLCKSNPHFKSFQLLNNGGCTSIQILDRNKVVGFGQSRVHPNDHFTRKLGLTRALGRALKSMKN